MKQSVSKPVAVVIIVVVIAILAAVGSKYMNPQNEVNASMDERKRRMGDYVKMTNMTSGKQGDAKQSQK